MKSVILVAMMGLSLVVLTGYAGQISLGQYAFVSLGALIGAAYCSGMDADDHFSSAYDMAILARYAMQNPEFRILAATRSFVGDDYYMHNLNPLLTSYDGADGVKIGYTEIAGRTIVASATRDGHRVYVSLMGSKNLGDDCSALFDWVWKNFQW